MVCLVLNFLFGQCDCYFKPTIALYICQSRMHTFLTSRSIYSKQEMGRTETKEIVIVGGGICGLATALALHRKGIPSLVLERSETLRSTGAAVIVHPNGWKALDKIGIASKLRQTAIAIQTGTSISLDDGNIKEIPIGKGELRCLRRKDLIETLYNSLPVETVRLGCQVDSIKFDPSTSSPFLQLHDGSVLLSKVMIGCDGVHSVVANLLGLKSTKLLSTCVARGFTSYQEDHEFGSEFLMISKGHVQLGRMPVTQKLVYWFVTRPWTSQDSMVSKDFLRIRQTTMDSLMDFPMEVKDMIRKCDLNSLHITDLKYRGPWELLCKNFQKGAITVAGDAMHAMGPFIAQGGSASLEDAVVLARCLAQNLNNNPRGVILEKIVENAFDQYVKERRIRLFWLCLEAYLIGKLLDVQPSKFVKFIATAMLLFLFREPNGHSLYDCGEL